MQSLTAFCVASVRAFAYRYRTGRHKQARPVLALYTVHRRTLLRPAAALPAMAAGCAPRRRTPGDHFGWVGFSEHAAGAGRILGGLLMVAGFFLIARF